MAEKLALLAERRHNLIAKAEAQRNALSQATASLQTPFAIADRGFRVVRYLKKHPILTLAATTLIGFMRPSRLSKWLKTSLSVFQLVRNTSGWFGKD
ncbi:MAG: hypothetical protein HOP21_03455 [Methylotenera sp.]|nr:hypothetical protein [Methylotenera sp.]